MVAQNRVATRSALAVATVLMLCVAFLVGRSTVAGGEAPVVPGPLRVIDGVSVGFVHSEAGAEAAAAHYLLEIERAMDTLDAAWTSKVASLVSTGGETRAITAHAAAVIALERSGGAPLRRIAISTDPVVFSPTTAQVTVLESWIYATTAQEALWAVERVSLAWQNGGWRVSAITGGSPSTDESLADLRSQLSFPGPGDASVR
jgi:hypothetical protein